MHYVRIMDMSRLRRLGNTENIFSIKTKMMLLSMMKRTGSIYVNLTGIVFPSKGRDICYDSMRILVLPSAPAQKPEYGLVCAHNSSVVGGMGRRIARNCWSLA